MNPDPLYVDWPDDEDVTFAWPTYPEPRPRDYRPLLLLGLLALLAIAVRRNRS